MLDTHTSPGVAAASTRGRGDWAPGHELLDLVEHRVLVAGDVEMVLAGNHHGARTGDARGHSGTAMAGSAARPDFETRSAHRGSAVTTFQGSRRALALC